MGSLWDMDCGPWHLVSASMHMNSSMEQQLCVMAIVSTFPRCLKLSGYSMNLVCALQARDAIPTIQSSDGHHCPCSISTKVDEATSIQQSSSPLLHAGDVLGNIYQEKKN